MTKEIVSVSLGPSNRDYEFVTQLFGEEVHVRRLGTDGDGQRDRRLSHHPGRYTSRVYAP
jgi:hypothetical protein